MFTYLLLLQATGYTPLMYAVKDNRVQLMERIMELGCDLTTVNKVNSLSFTCAGHSVIGYRATSLFETRSRLCGSMATRVGNFPPTGDDRFRHSVRRTERFYNARNYLRLPASEKVYRHPRCDARAPGRCRYRSSARRGRELAPGERGARRECALA